tara:strand:- start:5957 stop:7006 length:1050 start_codon:yes stop_codon:yes gene_type:complete
MRKRRIRNFAAIFHFLSILTLGGVSVAQAGPSAEVQTIIAKSGSLAETVVAYGTLDSKPSDMRSIILQQDSVIEDVLVHAGEAVGKDAPLLQISSTPLAAAQFAQAESTYALARKDLERLKRLKTSGLASNDQLSIAGKTLSDAEAQLRAQRQMGSAQKSTVIKAPFAGVITSIIATPGDMKAAGSVLATIGGRSRLIANLGLEPEDAMKVKKRAKLTLAFPLDDSATISGSLSSIGGMIDPQSRLVPAVASMDDDMSPAPVLGSTMVAHIFLPPVDGVLVPRTAILEDAEGTYLFVNEGGKAQRKNVVIAVETDSSSLIASGITKGDRVITTGNAALDDGVSVHEAGQ